MSRFVLFQGQDDTRQLDSPIFDCGMRWAIPSWFKLLIKLLQQTTTNLKQTIPVYFP